MRTFFVLKDKKKSSYEKMILTKSIKKGLTTQVLIPVPFCKQFLQNQTKPNDSLNRL